jgi:6-phosphogluconolactonase (cycloisomerase 2 family)
MKRVTLLLGLVLASVALLTGCPGLNLFGPGGLSDTWTVTYVDVKPRNPTVVVGATQQFRLVANFMDFHDEDKTGVSQWSSSNPAVATINNVGVATALAVGTTKIKGTYKGYSDDTWLTVVTNQPAVQSMLASGTAMSFTLTATGREYGYVLDRDSGLLAAFASPSGGDFEQTSQIELGANSRPWTLALHPSGRWLYVGNRASADVSIFEVDPWAGTLMQVEGSPVPVAVTPLQLSVGPRGRTLVVRDPRTARSLTCKVNGDTGEVRGPDCTAL